MLPAPGTELLKLQPVRLGFAVLRRRIIPLFAIAALHCNDLSGHTKPAPSFLALKTCFLVWRGRPRPRSLKSHLRVPCTSYYVPSKENRMWMTTALLRLQRPRELRESKMHPAFTPLFDFLCRPFGSCRRLMTPSGRPTTLFATEQSLRSCPHPLCVRLHG
jgi:hypothetical protein